MEMTLTITIVLFIIIVFQLFSIGYHHQHHYHNQDDDNHQNHKHKHHHYYYYQQINIVKLKKIIPLSLMTIMMMMIMMMAFESTLLNNNNINYSQSIISSSTLSSIRDSIRIPDLISSSIDIISSISSSTATTIPTENINQTIIINNDDDENGPRNYATYEELELLDKNWQIMIIFLYTLTAALALFGNILAICVLLFGKRSSKELRIFLVNLSMSDIMMALFSIPFTYMDFMLGRWIFAPAFCPIVQQMQMTCVFVSVYTLTAIGIDRYMAIIYPLYSQRYNRSFGPVTISIIWLFGFLLGLFQWNNTKATPFLIANETNYDCKEISSDHSQFFTIIIFIITFALPMSILSFTYASIGVKIFRHSAPGNVDVVRDRAQHASKVKIMKMLVTIVILFVVCWLPLHILNLFIYFARDLMVNVYNSQIGFTIYVTIAFTAHWFSMANSFVNPIIYCFMSENFRADLRDLFAECLYRMNLIINPIHSDHRCRRRHHHHHRRRRGHFFAGNQNQNDNNNNNDKNNKKHHHCDNVDDDDNEHDGDTRQRSTTIMNNNEQIIESSTKNSNCCQLQLTELHNVRTLNNMKNFPIATDENDVDDDGNDDDHSNDHRSRLLCKNKKCPPTSVHYYHPKIISKTEHPKESTMTTIIIENSIENNDGDDVDDDDNNNNNKQKTMLNMSTKIFKKTIVSDHDHSTSIIPGGKK
ncbi:uncharacterized protein LOC124494818 isoform X3 [Dermatophagoides farinae]|uniref:uncharacterized protein LOC124494818 isoform X3 n=1 Tax=Dermatophagoides farinae TaxID=6954 RepID=UPI003F62D3A8